MELTKPADLPPLLETRFNTVRQRLAPLDFTLPEPLNNSAARVLVSSAFVLDVLERHGHLLMDRLADDALLSKSSVERMLELDESSESGAMAALRRVRNIEMARIAWRGIAGVDDIATELANLSALADGLVVSALNYARRLIDARFAKKYFAEMQPPPMLILAMGKLGGRELNFSSDIDLILTFPDDHVVAAEVQPYFIRLAQQLIKLLDERTADGIVYRTDTRLRPFGTSGPLAIGVSALESYLVSNGRDWERYAYLKARLLNEPEFEPGLFREVLTPYVYRRYLDFGVIDALRQIKRLIRKEVERRDMADNVKLGPGGIREIEFIVQAHQLVRGGSDPELRERSLLRALPRLAGERMLSEATVHALEAGYLYLRQTENRLQALEDWQTHLLPSAEEERARLSYAMHEPAWPAMSARLAEIRQQVAAAFEDVVADAAETDVVAPFRSIWDSGDLDQLADLVSDRSASSRDAAIAALRALRNGSLYSRMDEHSQERLIDVLAKTLTRLSDDAEGATVLRRILPIYEATCRRSAYLALISENQHALGNLVALAKRSERLCSQVAERPILLDELLDARVFEAPLTRQESRQLFERRLAQIDTDDIETSLDAIRQFQAASNFRTAINDTLGHLPLMQVSDRLTDTAERCIEFALKLAWTEMRAKHGSPASLNGDREPGLAVIAYGKLGGLELGYGSDLDLVFVHDLVDVQAYTDGPRPLPNAVFFVRLTQRLINILSIQTPAGRLYEIDTRLRPSGESGQLVTSISSFERYQLEDAWVWEHQALLRSRPVAGPPELCSEFNRIRRSVLTRQVDGEHLKREIANMRQRMRDNLSQSEGNSFDVKQDPGGLADIEFLVDYLVLSHAHTQPELVAYPDNIRQLEALASHGILKHEAAERLKDCYLQLRKFIHDAALDNRARVVPAEQFENEREFITGTWAEVFG